MFQLMLGVQNQRRIFFGGGGWGTEAAADAPFSSSEIFFLAFFGMSTSAKINLVIAEKCVVTNNILLQQWPQPGAHQMEPPSPTQALGVNPFPSRFINRTVP